MPHHIHGGAPQVYFEKFGLTPRPVIDYSVNVSPLGPPPVLRERWANLFETIGNYPSINGDGIAEYYVRRFGLKRENILPGNGSTECLYLVPRVLAFQKTAIITPSFHDYERASQLAGAEMLEIPLSSENMFETPSLYELTENLTQADALLLGNPNNPTNTVTGEETIMKLADQFPEKWILVDEAFIQFLPDFKRRTLIRPDRIRRNILVFHSLTKFYDIPGIRLGCVIGHPEIITTLQASKEPWTVNGIAEETAKLLSDCEAYEKDLHQLISNERTFVIKEISEINGVDVFDSQTNYFLARWTASDDLDDLLRYLLKEGLYVRDCRNFRHLEDNFFRFSIRGRDDNTRFLSLLKQISGEFE